MRTKSALARGIIVLVALLIAAQAPPAGARSDCTPAVQNGRWTGSYQETLTVRYTLTNAAGTVTLQWEATYTLYGNITLQVACDGSVTGSGTGLTSGLGDIAVIIGGATVFTGRYGAFSTGASLVTGNVTQGAGGLPLFTLDYARNFSSREWGRGYMAYILSEGTLEPLPSSFFARSDDITDTSRGVVQVDLMPQPGRLSGTGSAETLIAARDQMVGRLAARGYSGNVSTSLTSQWSLTNFGPEILMVSRQYDQVFLAGVPLKNTYTILVDWKQDNSPTRRVDISVNGNLVRSIVPAGDVVTHDFDMGQDFQPSVTGVPNTITIVATGVDGTSPTYRDTALVVPVPAWAGSPSNFSWVPIAGSRNVLYRIDIRYPAQSFDLSAPVNPDIPLLGGTWGLVGTQTQWRMLTSSSGRQTLGDVAGNPRLVLGSWRNYGIDVTGTTTETLASGGLDLAGGQVTITPPRLRDVSTLGILSLIPGWSVASNIAVVGSVLKALNRLNSISLEVGAGFQATGLFDDNGPNVEWTGGEGTADASMRVTLDLELLIAGIEVSGGGTGSLTARFKPAPPAVTRGTITLFFTAQGRLVGFTIGPYSKEWPWSFPSGGPIAETDPPATVAARLEERPPLPPNYARFTGAERPRSRAALPPGSSEQTVVQQAYRQARPRLAVGPSGQAALVWVHDDAAKATQQAKEIYASLYDGNTWSSPVAITNDTNQDFGPAVAVDVHGNAMVTWMRHTTSGLPSTVSLDSAFVSGFDIWYARYEAAARNWSSPAALSSNSFFEHSPRLAAARDGSMLAVWVANQSNTLVGTPASPDALMYSRWDGLSWSHPLTVTTVSGLLYFDAALADSGSSGSLLLARDEDGDLSTPSDWELYSASWNGASWSTLARVTNDTAVDDSPRVTYDSSNTPQFFWRRDGALVTASGAPTATLRTVASNVTTGPVLASGSDNRLAAVWATATLSGTNLVGVTYDGQSAWSGPRQLTVDTNMNSSPSGGYLPTGQLMLGYSRTPVTLASMTLTTTGQVITNVPSVGPFSDLMVGTFKDVSAIYLPLLFKGLASGW